MKHSKEIILEYLERHSRIDENNQYECFATKLLAEQLFLERSSVSRSLNELCRDGIVEKIKGKPVLYRLNREQNHDQPDSFGQLLGAKKILSPMIHQAKASILYPSKPLNVMLIGNKGCGKEAFAKCMHHYAKEKKLIQHLGEFHSLDCNEYLENMDALFALLFEGDDSLLIKCTNGTLLLKNFSSVNQHIRNTLIPILEHGAFVYENQSHPLRIIVAETQEPTKPLTSSQIYQSFLHIDLPELNMYSLKERLQIIKKFLFEEAQNIKTPIQVETGVLSMLLLYDCPGNFSQLRKDIILSCAKAYVDSYESCKIELIELTVEHLSTSIKKGIFYFHEKKEKVEQILDHKKLYRFNPSFSHMQLIEDTRTRSAIGNLMSNTLVNFSVHSDQETEFGLKINEFPFAFTEYYSQLRQEISTYQELENKVSPDLIEEVSNFLNNCQNKFDRIYGKKILFSLCLHIQQIIQKDKTKALLSDSQLAVVLNTYPEEHKYATSFVISVEARYHVQFSIDDIALIALFLSEKCLEYGTPPHPEVLILMHGNGAAQHMSHVVNQIIGYPVTHHYDMALNIPMNLAYEEIAHLVTEIDNGYGVIILSDMGALSFFGSMMANDLSVDIRTIEMVSTPIALQCAHKVMFETDIDIIYRDLIRYSGNLGNSLSREFKLSKPKKENVIITICLTGEGSAIKLKSMIENSAIIDNESIDVVPLSIMNYRDAIKKIQKIAKTNNIIAIVGTYNPGINNIPFLSIEKMLLNNNYSELKQIIANNLSQSKKDSNVIETSLKPVNRDPIKTVHEYLEKEITAYEYRLTKPILNNLLKRWEDFFQINYSTDKKIGIIVHIASALENIINHNRNIHLKHTEQYFKTYPDEATEIKNSLSVFEEALGISIPDTETICLLIILLELDTISTV